MMLVQALTPQKKKWLGIQRNLLKCIKKLMVCRNEERLAKESVPVTANFPNGKNFLLQALSPEDKERLGFEPELLKYIEKLMLELKTKVRRNEERLAKENVPVIAIDDQVRVSPFCAVMQPPLS